MKKCPECEEEMDEDLAEAGLCSECGADIDASDLEDDDDNEEKEKDDEE